MAKILNNQTKKRLLLFSILVLAWCVTSSTWERPAFCAADKNIMLSPQGKGSAWNLPAGQYGEDEQTGPNDNQGQSPVPGQGGSTNTGQGGSPIPGDGSVGPGGSPIPGRGGNIGPGGSPRPAN
jgi:hypothetical protein